MTPRQAVDRVRAVPADMALLLEGRSGDERHPDLGWTPAGYVSHVTDNLRIWAERLAGARLAGVVDVQGYDPDALAEARGYGSVPAAAALWSLPIAADAWARSVSAALEEQVVLRHAKRGPQRAEDVARNNAHDAVHHLWDIRRILAYADGTGGGV
ncbi:hypothetical protein KNE206_40100 [Kitasatospora sp. NE20-6]|uniref:DinB family protein n=1 Tax=Kitasatospora sp. NE20-6 TaxID=2859066 RepID=UPI0034DC8277